MKQGQQMTLISKKIGKAFAVMSTCIVLASCGGGGGGDKIDSSITPPTSSVVLPELLSTVNGTRVDARDALKNLPDGYTADDVALSLVVTEGTEAEITLIEKGLWLVIPKVSALGSIGFKLETKLAGNTQSQILTAMAYPDVDEARQIVSLGKSDREDIAVGKMLSFPLQIRQVKTTTSPGASVRVHFSSSAWDWSDAVLTEMDSKLASGVVYQDTENYDGDASTDYFVLFSWFHPTGWSVPHDENWQSLATLTFERKADESKGSRFKISVIDEPMGIKSILIAASVGTL